MRKIIKQRKTSIKKLAALQLENEILRLKVEVELGGKIIDVAGGNPIPIEVENQFLLNILAFEHQFEHASKKTIQQILGNPNFESSQTIHENNIAKAIKYFNQLMLSNHLQLNFKHNYSNKLKYDFITNEFLQHTIALVKVEGIITHFYYEDFYPNYEMLLEESANTFMKSWFNQSAKLINERLSDVIQMPNNTTLHKQSVFKKLQHFFAAYQCFYYCEFSITQIQYDIATKSTPENGKVKGELHYHAILENNEEMLIEGSFELSMQYLNGKWKINYFTVPNFKW